VSLADHCARILEELATEGLIRRPHQIEGPQGAHLRVDGRSLLSFSSNNYLGLADHPALLAAARRSHEVDGLGASASRLITGTMDAHVEAEEKLASFVEAEAALLFSTGYAANVGALQALAGSDTVVFSDALNHASLIDGTRLSRAQVHVYQHVDLNDLEARLRHHRGKAARALIVTDTLFSMDGDLAPIRALRALADRYDAALFVDEAHALGVLGPQGRGLCAREGVVPDVLVGTLGKSFGGAGAFVAGTRALRELLLHRARSFVFSTAPLPLLARVAVAATDLVREADDQRAALAAHSTHLRTRLTRLGFAVPIGESPIIPVLVGDPHNTMIAASALYEAGFIAQGIRPPTVPPGTSRIRLVPIATHTTEEVEALIDAFTALP
jgi:8-amino-7-oxononanoate synthase